MFKAKQSKPSAYHPIKETEKPFETEFNQSKAKTNDNCCKLSASDPHGSETGVTKTKTLENEDLRPKTGSSFS